MTTPRKRKALSHSARESYQLCPRKHFFQYEMRLEPVEGKSSLRMGKAFSHALEYRDPARSIEGYWEGVPLHDRISDGKAELEIAQVELLAELYLARYAEDVAPGRIWTPEFEFKSKLLGHGFLDAIIEESNGRESTCPVHGEVQGLPGHGLLDLDGVPHAVRARGDELRGEAEAGAPPVVHALPGGLRGAGDRPPVQEPVVREPGSPEAGHAQGQHVARGARPQDTLQVGARVHAGEHEVPVQGDDGQPLVSGVRATCDGSVPRKACSCRRWIGCENKLLGSFWWNDAARLTLAIDSQCSAYFAACREVGKPLDHMLFRVTKKPTIRPDSRKRETLGDYLKRLRDRIEADPSATFEQHQLYRTEQQMDAFIEGIDDINAQVRLSRRKGAWPMSTKACTMFGGCSFLPICRDEPVEGLYRERPLPEAKPKLPRLGKVQRAVLLALGDAFASPVALSALAKQVAYAQSSVASAVKSLQERGYIADDGVIEGETYWDVMPEGREVIALLNEAGS